MVYRPIKTPEKTDKLNKTEYFRDTLELAPRSVNPIQRLFEYDQRPTDNTQLMRVPRVKNEDRVLEQQLVFYRLNCSFCSLLGFAVLVINASTEIGWKVLYKARPLETIQINKLAPIEQAFSKDFYLLCVSYVF